MEDLLYLRKDRLRANTTNGLFILFLMVVAPGFLIPFGFVLASRDEYGYGFIMGGSFAFFIGIIALTAQTIKQKLGPYAHNGVPIFLSMVWVLIALPFWVILPYALRMAPSQSDHFITAGLLKGAFILLIGTSFLAQVLNTIFRKIELELKAKLAVKKLVESLKVKNVKG